MIKDILHRIPFYKKENSVNLLPSNIALINNEVNIDKSEAYFEKNTLRLNPIGLFSWSKLFLSGAILSFITVAIASLSGLNILPWLTLSTDTVKALYLVGISIGLLSLILSDELRPFNDKE